MGQKTRPTGFRVGITEDWRSKWYAPKREFGILLVEDFKIRKFVSDEYKSASIAKVVIERTRDQVIVNLHSARPGMIIGRKGANVNALRVKLQDMTKKKVKIDVNEIAKPEIEATQR